MRKLREMIERRGKLPALILLLALLLPAALLLPQELLFSEPEQEYENNEVKRSRIVFSKPSGFYEDPFTLWIKAPTKEIYYTLDGSEPARGAEGTYAYDARQGIRIEDATGHENVYSLRTDVTTGFDLQAIEELSKGRRVMNYQVPEDPVDKCTVLRAVFYDMEGNRSEIQTGAYFVGFEGREGYGGIRTVSIVTDPDNLFDYDKGIYVTGKTFADFSEADSFHNDSIWYRHFWWWWDANYHNSGRDWERSANVQFFDEDGSLILQQEAGIRIQGGGSRGFLPKSLNLYSRKDYDGNTRFHYDFFGTGYEAKRMTLTSCGDDCYTKLKDRMVSELAEGQGFATMHYEPCLLFLDGEFWGFYYLTEKYDEKYFSYYYDVPEEEVVEIKNNKIEVGEEEDLKLYEDMRTFIEESDMSLQENYEKACGLIDMDSFINYYAALIYCGRCGDWPNGNFALWRTRPASTVTEDGAENAETGDTVTEDGTENAEAGDTVTEDGTENAEAGDTVTEDGTGNAEAEYTGTDAEEGAETDTSPYRDGRWRWILFDVNSAAISSELQEHDTLHYVLHANKMRMFRSLWANFDFREKFSQRLLEYGGSLFTPESVNTLVDQYETEMDEPMALHFERFFGKDSGLDFPEIVRTEIRDFFVNRYSVMEDCITENSQ